MRSFVGLSLLLAACATNRPQHAHDGSHGVAGHEASAEDHEQAAVAHDQAAAEANRRSGLDSYDCGDPELFSQSTSGTEPVDFNYMPCWNIDEETAIRHQDAAARERRAARVDRARADALAYAEHANCRGIPKQELDHSPFAHRQSIQEIVAHRDDGEIKGVRIVFKPTPGLTAAYLRRAIACNQARFVALGNPPTFFSAQDPTLVEGATVEVTENSSHIVVFVKVRDDVQAAVAFARAQDLVTQRTAVR
jgi:hypothetical protein